MTLRGITLGDVRIWRLEELTMPGMPVDQWYPDFDQQEWDAHQHLLTEQDWDPAGGHLHTCMQSWIVQSGGRTIVVDTGVGNDKPRPGFGPLDSKQSPYLERLATIGVTPDEVDMVITTHLHMDHVGFNTTLVGDVWVPTFPNADYVVSDRDIDFWNPANDERYSRRGDAFMSGVWADSVAPVIDAGRVTGWTDSFVVDEHLTIESAPGHTPGNAVIKVVSGPDRGVFIGDMLHSPIQIPLAHWNSCFCEDPVASRKSRERTLAWAADSSALVFAGHFGHDKAAEVERRGSGFDLKGWKGFDEGDR